MDQQLEEARHAALLEVSRAGDEAALETARLKYLGQSGIITVFSRGMKDLTKEDKPRLGKLLNEVRSAIAKRSMSVKQRCSRRPTRKRFVMST